jgi:hypothetical protein
MKGAMGFFWPYDKMADTAYAALVRLETELEFACEQVASDGDADGNVSILACRVADSKLNKVRAAMAALES